MLSFFVHGSHSVRSPNFQFAFFNKPRTKDPRTTSGPQPSTLNSQLSTLNSQLSIDKTLKRLIWLYFWLLIFEGVFRKWIVPQLANPLLLVRDPVLLLI